MGDELDRSGTPSTQRDRWPADCGPSKRWTVYTRGNVGEVYPEVVLPLEWDLGGAASEAGWQTAAATVGFAGPRDFGDEPFVVLGVFGGYAYFNVSLMRLLGVRTPGLAPDVIDSQFLGDSDVSPYRRQPGDRSLAATLKVIRTAARTLLAKDVPRLAEMRSKVETYRAKNPGPDAPDEVLLAYIEDGLNELWAYLISSHVIVTMQATIASGALTDLCEKHLGDPNKALELTTGIGNVVSAEPAAAMWRLANETEDNEFDAAFADFLEQYGHRGPNEFSLHGRDWAHFPELARTAIDSMRGLDPSRAPQQQNKRIAAEQTAALHAAKARLGRLSRRLDRAIASAALWSRAREESKDLVIRGNQGARHAFLELVRRAAARGGVADRTGPMLLSRDEFVAYLDDPPSMVEIIEGRRAHYEQLAALEPPFAFDVDEHGGSAPAENTWRARQSVGSADNSVSVGSAGTELSGQGGSPGVARGRARVVVDPGDPFALEPGNVLVAPLTDPSWTPLFVGSAAVVVEVGAAMSHSMIVSRELGIPCVVGVDDATLRIPDGALVEVDGTAGTVRLL